MGCDKEIEVYFPVESLAEDSTAFGGTIFNYGRRPLPGELMLRKAATSCFKVINLSRCYRTVSLFGGTIFNYGRRPLPGELMPRKVATSALR
ncbi:hypothetical protein LVD17_24010 [Fulvivirga ulvae]|uniref:hypothetical protein n=1 Tax=Fulvivirga ulvae TaxID=2904245 RepID=UPI001F1982EA|nr:hypothetical protein [Fulvivirga ulvae]UII31362.1 hypothetical protein LVD17_24010 [Fulvivirga ulvae]